MVSGVSSSDSFIKSPPVAASSAALPSSTPVADAAIESPGPIPRTPSVSTAHESPRPPTRSSTTTPLATPSVPVKSIAGNISPSPTLATIEFTAITPPLLPATATPNSPPFVPLAGHRLPIFTPPVPWTVETDPSQPWPPRSTKGKRRTRLVASKPSADATALDDETQLSLPVTPSTSQSEVFISHAPMQPMLNIVKLMDLQVASTGLSVSSSLRIQGTSDDKKELSGTGPKASGGNKSSKANAQNTPIIPALPKASPKGWATDSKKAEGAKETTSTGKTAQEVEKASFSNLQSALPNVGDGGSEDSKPVGSSMSVKSGDEVNDSTVNIDNPSSEASKEEAKTSMPSRSIWTVDNVKSRIVGATNTSFKNGTPSVLSPGATKSTASSLADALKKFNPTLKDSKVTFIKPRGLFNAGNMCYMNSVLQVLVFCPPFYNLLSIYGNNAVHSFKSENPLLEAM